MPNITPNFRSICAALLDEILHESPTTCLARAALVAEPQGPTDEEIRDLAEFDHGFDRYDQKDDQGNEAVVWECYDQSLIAFARAVLARYGGQS